MRPVCRKCINTGRICDGYDFSFKPFSRHSVETAATSQVQSSTLAEQKIYTPCQINQENIDLLARYLSIKSIFDDRMNYKMEARQILESCLIDLSTRHAVESLKLLRYQLETPDNGIIKQTLGIQQYISALTGIASTRSPRSVLICCQVFISIEQLLMNYSAMIRHIIGGVRLLSECRAQSGTKDGTESVDPGTLPRLDIFIIKMFTTPCKFAEPPAIDTKAVALIPASTLLPEHPSLGLRRSRLIAPDLRTELVLNGF